MTVFRKYVDHQFRDKSLILISHVNAIIAEYEEMKQKLTVRQIHYKLTNRADYDNTQANYKNLIPLLSRAREAGLVSWTAIVDLERGLKGLGYTEHPHDLFKGIENQYTRDKWADQPMRPEFWVEKKSQEGILGQVCNELEVDYYATKGYNSHSEAWRAAQRFAQYIKNGQRPIIFYFSDYDWAGLDMYRDIQEKLTLYCGTPILVQRLALTYDQVEEFDLPSNPIKDRDLRIKNWPHGDECWELDAHEPAEIQRLIRDAVEKVRDVDKWDASLQREVEEKMYVQELVQRLGIGDDNEEQE